MDNYLNDLAQMKVFSGIEPANISVLLDCLHASYVQYSKDEMIIEEGNHVHHFGVILEGHVRSIKWDTSDRIIILSTLEKGDEIGVLLAALSEKRSPVYVQAQDDVSILSIPYERIFSSSIKACPMHAIFLKNYISIIAEKGLILHERINCLLKPTVREKIMTYLLRISHEQDSSSFQILFNRKEMAEYLNIERSALSRELSSMKQDGLIDYHMNHFTLL